MSEPRLDDLGLRIDACIKKHGITPEKIRHLQRREEFNKAMVKLSASMEEFNRQCAEAMVSITLFAQKVRRNG